ncbi:MAG: SurA N-terminal domain-containing protein [Bdellovibrionota bacterium]
MLTEIRRYKKSFTGLLIACFCALLMGSFGLNARGCNRESANNTVIRVDGHKIQYDEYYRQLQTLTEIYRRQFGPNFSQLRQFINLEQQTVDSIIEDKVAGDFLRSLGLSASTSQIEGFIMQLPFFQKFGLNKQTYEAFLRSEGLTGQGLEAKMRQDLEERQLQSVLSDLNRPTTPELKAVFLEQNTKAEFSYVSFKPADFEKKVVTTDQEKLKQYYEGYADKYRKPRSVSYSYVVFEPSRFLDKVEISEDDLRERYNQKQSLYYEPKEIKLREIVFNKEPEKPSALEEMVGGSDDKKGKDAVNEAKKATAKSIVERLKNGEDFQALAKQYSEDKESGANGGDLGWTVVSKLDKEVRSVAERVEKGKYSDVIETPTKLVIVFIDDVKERTLKPFETVRPEIEREVRQNDAPEYARVESENFYQRWMETEASRKMSLADFAAKEHLDVKTTEKLLAKGEDPADAPGLTEKVISLSPGDKQTVRAGVQDYVVQINEAKESYLPELDAVKETVTKDYVATESKLLAKHAAEDALQELKGTAAKDAAPKEKKTLEQVAAANSLEVKTTPPASRADTGTDPFLSLPDVKRVAFSLNEASPVANQVFQGNDEYFVAMLKSKTPPDEKLFAEKQKSLAETEQAAAAKRFSAFVVQSLRASADVWVDPKLLDKQTPSADL